MGLVGVAPGVAGQLGEAGLVDTQHGAVAVGLQGELDVCAARVVLGQASGSRQVYANTVGSSTRSTRMSTGVIPPATKVMVAAAAGRRSMLARSAEPPAQTVGRGERLPHLSRRAGGQGHSALDARSGNAMTSSL